MKFFFCSVSYLIFFIFTVLSSIIIGVSLVFPIPMIGMGFIYYDQCPANFRIPVYLLIGGRDKSQIYSETTF